MGDVPSVAMRAVWLDARPARGFLRAPYARSLDDFRREFAAWPLLGQNVVYADTAGSIAWQFVGEVPRRRKGWGTLPLPAADPEAGWHEEGVPFDQMPHAADPDAGFIATANARPIPDDAPAPYLGADWLDGYRQARIAELLDARKDWDVAASMRVQMDETTLAWREIRDAVLAIPPLTAGAGVALGLLRDWDGRLAADSIAASVFELFTTEVWRRMADARAPRSRQYALGLGLAPLLPVSTFAAGRWSTVYRRIREQPQGWFERGWQAEMSDALDAAIHKLRSDFGREQSGWAWGRIRRLTLAHPMAVIPPLAFAFNRGPFPWGGDGNTISQAGAAPLKMPSSPGVIASLRMTVDVGNWDASRFALPGGQSGNPFSPHYDDQLPLWLRGDGVPIAWTPVDLAAVARDTLYITPLPDSGAPQFRGT
jgi:penicillin amidase